MNTDKRLQDPQMNYYPILNEVQQTEVNSKQKPILNSEENLNKPLLNTPQQVHHNYQPFHQNQHQNPYHNQNQHNQHINHNIIHQGNIGKMPHNFIYPNQNQNQISTRPILVQPQVIYQNQVIPPIVSQKPIPTQIISISTDKHDAIKNGQSFPCQRCGLKDVGPLILASGQAAIGWGACLFFFTGMFCFIPCFTNSCKDTHILCARCGYKKAIVRANCCC